ncbi:MAG: PD-(D/E)XK nuclease family protein [Tidjanibacter sp.]|nr:PD-(D/E)XK nuclease family protein [Tidjanibacter sp.]
METFLHSVAADLFDRLGEELSDCMIVMPNNRSRIFFVDALSEVAGRTVWSPQYASLDELMSTIAHLGVVDGVRASVELYKVYSQYHTESFDSFYHWGEVMRNDFDAIDKYMVDADRLFANIVDLKTFDADLSYLTEEQIALVREFWSSYEGGRDSDEKQKFLALWRSLPKIYHSFHESIERLGVSTVGGVQRRAAELIRAGYEEPLRRRYAVVGFNALSQTEKEFFGYLKKHHDTLFYWDYDHYYFDQKRQEAGLFLRDNVRDFPAPEGFEPKSDFSAPKQINVVSVASDSLQTKYAADFLRSIISREGKVDYRTAIVLTDESLLSPLLYSLPDEVGKVNITMGYPIKSSLAYSFVERLLLLQSRARRSAAGEESFYHADVTGLLSHPYLTSSTDGPKYELLRLSLLKEGRIRIASSRLASVTELADALFRIVEGRHSLSDYLIEALSKVDALLSQTAQKTFVRRLEKEIFELFVEQILALDKSLSDCGVEIENSTYTSLLRRMLQSLRIPYSGEPLRGVQIMGILETRNLDFDNVMILSMSDDVFPSSRLTDLSLIPYNLRFAYSLPTPQRSEGVYAYYFYRLLQRSKRVDLVYCSVADERSSGEQSRYIYQLDYESPHKLTRCDKGLDVNLAAAKPLSIRKCGEVANRLQDFLAGGGSTISPTALNDYSTCPLKFYFARVARIRVEDQITEEVDGSMFGNILHYAIRCLYEPLKNLPNPQQLIARITKEQILEAVNKAISKEYFNCQTAPADFDESELGGQILMVRESVMHYIGNNILPYDAARIDDYQVVALEETIGAEVEFEAGRKARFSGKVDRIDRTSDGRLLIIDYKTGSVKDDFKGISSLLPSLPAEHNGAALQTLVYSMMVERNLGPNDTLAVCPMLYYVRHLGNPDYSPLLNDKTLGRVTSYADYAEEFEQQLALRLIELFDISHDFEQTADRKSCEWCDFAKICRR